VRHPQFVYDDLYVLRGDVENRLKELKLELKADRLSCHRFLDNQFRCLASKNSREGFPSSPSTNNPG